MRRHRRHLLVLGVLATALVGAADLPGVPALPAQAAECGVDKWSVKTGSDPDAAKIDTRSTTPTTVEYLHSITRPSFIPADRRVEPTETTVYGLTATLQQYRLFEDSDYHLIVIDPAGRTLIVELAHPDCVDPSSPLKPGIVRARQAFERTFTATPAWQSANVTVTVRGVGFFDYFREQRGMAPNGLELHPLLDFALGTAGEPAPSGDTVWLHGDVVEITAGNRPVLSGVVSNASGAPVPGAAVQIHRKAYGEASYSQIIAITADGNGRFAVPVAPTKQTSYVARAEGASSAAVVIRVHSRISVDSPVAGSTVPARTTFSGSLSPSYQGVAVGLAVIRNGRYTYLGQAPTSADGRFAIAASMQPGTYAYVVYTSAHAGTLYGSKSLTLTA